MSCPSNSSGIKNADAAIFARPCVLMGVVCLADGTNAADVKLYDNASAASGTEIAHVKVDAGLVQESFVIEGGVVCNNGIYADVTGTGATYIVYFRPI